MKRILFLLALLCLEKTLSAQTPYVYSIKADSVKITNTCDTAELIVENHTQTVPGFLFNKGRGRTEFRRVMEKINDNLVLIGADTLRIPNAWVQGGNRFGATGVFGTMDNNPVDFYTNGIQWARLTNMGRLLIGNNPGDNGQKLQVYGNVFANGNQHKLGNLAIVSGDHVAVSGFGTGIRIDDPSFGSFIFQGTIQGWAHDMFVFTDDYGGIGQDVYDSDQSILKIGSGIKKNNKEDNSCNVLNIQPKYDLDATSTRLTIRGIYYKPNLINTLGSKHIAIETVTGDVKLNTTNGKTSIGLDTDSGITSKLDVTGDNGYNQFRLRKKYTPTSSSDANGNVGDMSWDDNYIYIKTAEGWKRSTLSSF